MDELFWKNDNERLLSCPLIEGMLKAIQRSQKSNCKKVICHNISLYPKTLCGTKMIIFNIFFIAIVNNFFLKCAVRFMFRWIQWSETILTAFINLNSITISTTQTWTNQIDVVNFTDISIMYYRSLDWNLKCFPMEFVQTIC